MAEPLLKRDKKLGHRRQRIFKGLQFIDSVLRDVLEFHRAAQLGTLLGNGNDFIVDGNGLGFD
jgi:hypothetical protein